MQPHQLQVEGKASELNEVRLEVLPEWSPCSHTPPEEWLTPRLWQVGTFPSPLENARVAIKIWVRLDKPQSVWNDSKVWIEAAQSGAAAVEWDWDSDISQCHRTEISLSQTWLPPFCAWHLTSLACEIRIISTLIWWAIPFKPNNTSSFQKQLENEYFSEMSAAHQLHQSKISMKGHLWMASTARHRGVTATIPQTKSPQVRAHSVVYLRNQEQKAK